MGKCEVFILSLCRQTERRQRGHKNPNSIILREETFKTNVGKGDNASIQHFTFSNKVANLSQILLFVPQFSKLTIQSSKKILLRKRKHVSMTQRKNCPFFLKISLSFFA